MVTLRELGYSLYVSDISRHAKLKYAIQKIGYSQVVKKLQTLKQLYKYRAPELSANAKYDLEWLKSIFN